MMNRPLYVDQALHVLELLPSPRAIEIAEHALCDGHETDAIVDLASRSKREARWTDLDSLFEHVLADLGLRLLSPSEAQIIVVAYFARQYCDGDLSTRLFFDGLYRVAFTINKPAVGNVVLSNYLVNLDYLDSMYTEAESAHDLKRTAVWEMEALKICRRLLTDIPMEHS